MTIANKFLVLYRIQVTKLSALDGRVGQMDLLQKKIV